MKIFNLKNDIIKAAVENDLILIKELSKTYNLNFSDKNGKTPLFYAVLNESIEMCKFLMEQNVDMYIRDDRNLMAIHYAIILKNNEIIQLFKDRNFKDDLRFIEDECKDISIKDDRKFLTFIKKVF